MQHIAMANGMLPSSASNNIPQTDSISSIVFPIIIPTITGISSKTKNIATVATIIFFFILSSSLMYSQSAFGIASMLFAYCSALW